MPKWRKLHVKATESLDINEMPDDFHRLLWIMLPLGIDRRGRGLDTPSWIKSKVMTVREDVTPEMITMAMDWYASHEMIERYNANGRAYFWIPTWHAYQGDTSKEAESNFPAPLSYVDPKGDEGQEEGESRSGVGQEEVPTKLVSDSDSDAHVDSHADSHADSDALKETPPAANAHAPKPKPKRKSSKSKRPPTPEAVKVFRENAACYPAKSWYPDIVEAVGEESADLELWGRVVKAYVGQGWNPTNVANMLDFYGRREIPTTKGRGKSASEQPHAGIRQWLTEQGVEAQ